MGCSSCGQPRSQRDNPLPKILLGNANLDPEAHKLGFDLGSVVGGVVLGLIIAGYFWTKAGKKAQKWTGKAVRYAAEERSKGKARKHAEKMRTLEVPYYQ